MAIWLSKKTLTKNNGLIIKETETVLDPITCSISTQTETLLDPFAPTSSRKIIKRSRSPAQSLRNGVWKISPSPLITSQGLRTVTLKKLKKNAILARKIHTNKFNMDLIQPLSYNDSNLKYHMAEIRKNLQMTDRIEQLHPSAFVQIRLKYEKELMEAIKLMINIQVKITYYS